MKQTIFRPTSPSADRPPLPPPGSARPLRTAEAQSISPRISAPSLPSGNWLRGLNRKVRELILAAPMAVVFGGSPAVGAPIGPDVSQLDSTQAMNWLVKSVCVGSNNVPLSVDPYGGCPAQTTIRKIQVGEGLPYHNGGQPGAATQNDSFPIRDLAGQIFVLATHDFPPYNVFNLYNGTDGYDLYAVRGGNVTTLMTSDGGGYGQAIFGPGCTIGGGEVFFPASGFLAGGAMSAQKWFSYWEQSGYSFPGPCPSSYTTHTPQWAFAPRFVFGVPGQSKKTMDAMISYQGFQPNVTFKAGDNNHLEVFYFTKEYGITRWEVWRPTTQNPVIVKNCGAPTQTMNGVQFVVVDCADWSSVTPASSAALPVWPLPNINVIAHAHFDDGGGYYPDFDTTPYLWHRTGPGPAGNVVNWALRNSTSPRDQGSAIGQQLKGVRYLVTSCGAGSGQECSYPPENIYQDVPISSFTSNHSFTSNQVYGYGLQARTEPGMGVGTLQVTLQQLDAKGDVLWQDGYQATVTSDNGPDQSTQQPGSVYLSSAFIYKTVQIPVLPRAVRMRFAFAPVTPQTFDILDAWFAPWPALAAPNATVTACN